MKNIIIPTTFEPDTIQALKISSDFKNSEEVQAVLLSASAVSDSISELLFPSQWKQFSPAKRSKLLKAWDRCVKEKDLAPIQIHEHHQFGISRPVLTHILERFEADMIIVPYSLQQSKEYIDKTLLRLLKESKIPLMLLPNENEIHSGIHRALYIDENEALPASVQSLPFHVIHQSMVQSDGMQSLKSIVDDFRINLIVLAKGRERSLRPPVNDLGLPVLTV